MQYALHGEQHVYVEGMSHPVPVNCLSDIYGIIKSNLIEMYHDFMLTEFRVLLALTSPRSPHIYCS